MRRAVISLILVALCSIAAHSQTFTCPIGKEDMLNYFVMGYPARDNTYMGPGNANPIYSSISPDDQTEFATSGILVWTKSSQGYPWDVKSFDENYVYDRATELNWNDPTSFKRFNVDLPMTMRCVTVGKAGQAIRVASTDTKYGFYSNCSRYHTGTLNYVVNTLTTPKLIAAGGNMGAISTRLFKYHYNCDSSYANCADLEVFSLGYQIGLYDWKYYKAQNGKWVLQQESVINNMDGGQATPYLPCESSYE